MTIDTDKAADRRLDDGLAVLLRSGTLLACAIIGVGLAAQRLAAPAVGLRLVAIGMAVFLALPVMRLLVLLAVFLRRRDVGFALVVALVLAIIAVAFAVGALLPVGAGKPG